MVRELFEQELIAREKASFQGIGGDLELLAVLMEQYRKPFQTAYRAAAQCERKVLLSVRSSTHED